MESEKSGDPSRTKHRQETRLRLIAFAIALAPLCYLAYRLDFLTDDAYIVFRYGRNFAEGLGLRYNLGVEPPVEGYTQFLWVVWNALIIRVGLDVLVWSRLSLLAAGVGVLWVTVGLAARSWPQRPAIVCLCALFVGTFPPMAAWCTGGMEVMIFTLFGLLGYRYLLGDPVRPRGLQAGISLLLAGLTRSDAPVLIGSILFAAFLGWRGSRSGRTARAMAIAVGIVATGMLIHLVWRYGYYGDFVPNTFYCKVSPSLFSLTRGMHYVVEFMLTYPSIIILAIAVPLVAWHRPQPLLVHASVICLGICGYSIFVGGDFMTFRRFLVPMVPFAALLFGTCLCWLGDRGRQGRILAVGIGLGCVVANALPAFGLYMTPSSLRSRFHYNYNLPYMGAYEQWQFAKQLTENWALTGRALRDVSSPTDTLVSGTIGAIGYYSNLFVYDTNGLVTSEVARRPGVTPNMSAGHDKEVAPTFFLPKDPTYMHAMFRVYRSDADRERNFAFLRKTTPKGYRCKMIIHEPTKGYPEHSALFLLVRDITDRRQPNHASHSSSHSDLSSRAAPEGPSGLH